MVMNSVARAATLHAIANHLEGRAVAVFRPEAEVYVEYHAIAALLRRLADEAQPTPTKAEETQPAAELLALATVLEIPRPGSAVPLQLRRSWGYTDRWAICDREGRRWHREYGWVYEAQGIRDEAQRDVTRYTLAEAVPLAQQLAAGARRDGEQ